MSITRAGHDWTGVRYAGHDYCVGYKGGDPIPYFERAPAGGQNTPTIVDFQAEASNVTTAVAGETMTFNRNILPRTR